jgi:hypothetical protein
MAVNTRGADATEWTTGAHLQGNRSQSENLIDHLDLCHHQSIWQSQSNRHFHLFHAILLPFSVFCRTISLDKQEARIT